MATPDTWGTSWNGSWGLSWLSIGPTPPVTDTHDGFWSKKYREMHEWHTKKPTLEEVIEVVQEAPVEAVQAVKSELVQKYPEMDTSKIADNLKLQRLVAKLLIRKLELRRQQDIEDHNIRVLLLT